MTWQRTALWLLVLGMIFSDIGACAGPQVTQNTSSSEQTDVMAQILKEPASFESKTVTITAVFQGWRGPCRSGPPVSRSDWMIAGESGCLYVHGPMPPGLDPSRPSAEKISVTGVVRLKRGMPYLETGQ